MDKLEFKIYLKEIDFFVPSVEISITIAKALDAAHEADRAESLKDSEQTHEFSEEELDKFLAAIGVTKEQFENYQEPVSCPELTREYISEQLYALLAFQARSSENAIGKEFSVKEFLDIEMERIMGFVLEETLMSQLVQEFNDWGKERIELQTGWGQFTYITEGKFSVVDKVKTQ